MKFAHIENSKETYRGPLPKNWRNISGLDNAVDDLPFLKKLGFIPVVTKAIVVGDSETEDGETETKTASKITITQKKRKLSATEIKIRDTELWINEMQVSDNQMTRIEEDIIEALDNVTKQRLNHEVMDKYNAKKALRLQRPK